MPYSILIADDHSIIRSGIRSLIKTSLGITKIDEAANEREIAEKVKGRSYKLIFLDINMPGSDFVSMMSWLRTTTPETHILVFTTYPEDIYGKRALQLGARGFLRKTATNEEILRAFKTVLSDKIYINDELQGLLAGAGDADKQANPFDRLSARELEIALLIHKGRSLPEICQLLNIQYSTANAYKGKIFEKLEVHNAVTLSRLIKTFRVEG